VPVELRDVVRCFNWVGPDGVSNSLGILSSSRYISSGTDTCRSSLNAVRIPRRNRGSTSVLCWSTWQNDGSFQCPVEALHASIDCGMFGSCLRELNSTQSGQGVEEL
jgi:hypothetical protein